MDETLEIHAPPGRIQRSTVEVEGDDILAADQPRSHVARKEEVIGRSIVANAYVSEPVDDALPVEDTIGQDELVDKRGVGSRRHHDFGGMLQFLMICEKMSNDREIVFAFVTFWLRASSS